MPGRVRPGPSCHCARSVGCHQKKTRRLVIIPSSGAELMDTTCSIYWCGSILFDSETEPSVLDPDDLLLAVLH